MDCGEESNIMAKRSAAKNGNGANLGFEEKLWAAADKLRGHMDAAEYKHVVLGLVFRKFISDAFQEHHDTLADDDMQFDKRMQHLTAKLQDQFTESAKLDKAILKNLATLGFTGKEYP